MDVFKISPTAAYCGGAAYVAANNKEEAINRFINKLQFILNYIIF